MRPAPPSRPSVAAARGLALCLACVAFAASSLSASPDFGRMLEALTQRFGQAASASFLQWQHLIAENRGRDTLDKLQAVNRFFNDGTRFKPDAAVWGKSDYWATPMETLGQRQGDCEDFTIAKYFTLLAMGVPNQQLRLVYVNAAVPSERGPVRQAHMVLAYYPSPEQDPLVLDNLVGDIRAAGQRVDLLPIFSFNSEGIWNGPQGDAAPAGGVGRLSRWEQLLLRARQEGF